MKFLCFDIGANLGWAVGERPVADTPERDKLVVLKSGRELFFGSRVERFAQAETTVANIIRQYGPDVVAYERPFCRGIAATRSLWGYAGIIEAVATNANCALLDQVPSTIKRHMTGFGAASKGDMTAAVKRFLNYEVDNEHTADAVALLDYMTRFAEVTK